MALCTEEGNVTGKLAVAPAFTVEVADVKVGPVVGPDAESTSNWKVLELPPPGAGVDTAIASETPPLPMFAAGTCAVSCVALTNVVVSADDPQFTVEPVVKPVPMTVSVKAAPPAGVNPGEIPLTTGAGLSTV